MRFTTGWMLVLTLAAAVRPAAAQDTLRVLAYNVRHGAGMDDRIDLERTATVIRRLRPDVVTLQEIDVGAARTGGADQATELARLTGLPYAVFGPFMAYDGGHYGMAVLAAQPLADTANHRLPDGEEPRTALAGQLRLPNTGLRLTVVGIHLYRTGAERLRQAERLVEIFAGEPGPVLLIGDFNSTPADTVMRLLAAHWVLPAKAAGVFTWRSDQPSVDIDHVLYRPASRVRLLEYRVVDEREASDHRPVLAVVEVR